VPRVPASHDSIRQHFSPKVVYADGHEAITVANRFGKLTLARQVCTHPGSHTHALSGNAVLPLHHGMIIFSAMVMYVRQS
jgi:hypothetical protein